MKSEQTAQILTGNANREMIFKAVHFIAGKKWLNPLKVNGKNHPPKKKITIKAENNRMLQYSPKKNKAKALAENSVWNPATSSPSASPISKGTLLVSAKDEIKKQTITGNPRKQKHP